MKKHLRATTSMAACLLALGICTRHAGAETALREIVVNGKTVTTNFVSPDKTVMGGQTLLTTPTNVTVIDRERFNLDTVNYTNTRYELMTRVPGMTNVRNLRVPCGWCDYTVNLQNGMATRPLGRGNFNFDGANNFDIERIEIIKGPASALYPSHAFGGVINIITRKPPERPTLRTFADFGSWGRYRMGADFGFSIDDAKVFGQQIGRLGFKANASHYELDGWRDWRAEKKDTGSFRFVWDITPATTFEWGGTHTKSYSENPGNLTQAQWDADWGQAPDPYTSTTKSTYLDARLTHEFSGGGKFELPYGFVHETSTGRWGDNKSDRHDLKPRYTREFDFLASKLITGVDLSHSDSERIGRSDTRSVITSPYAQYEFSPFANTEWLDGLKFTLGGRYEYVKHDHEDFRDATNNGKKSFDRFTPHTGVTWKWNQTNSIWFSYSQGFNPPSARRMWPSSGRYIYLDNPNLKPEKAENFEIGARGSVLDEKFTYDVSWHDTTIKDFIQDDFIRRIGRREVHQYHNIGKVRLKGVEAQIGVWPVKWAGVEASYTYAIDKYVKYTRSGQVLDGKYMYATPKHHLNTRFILKPIDGAKLELEWDHSSKYFTDSANTETYKRPDLFNLSASYTWNGMVTFWGQVRNLTDRKYARRVTASVRRGRLTHRYRAGLPRSYAVGVTITAQF